MVDPISLIARFEHLPGKPKSDEARPLLEKIASQVKPLMKKRGWKVGTLAEFLPSNPSLLGLNQNAGQRINLRLRPPGNENTFYEYDQLVLVMLHELTHNTHGPHDAKFYKLLGELEEEYYELKRKGYSGEGFHSEGNHLSGERVSEYVGKARGLAAAEKRLKQQKIIGRGGVLGGTKDIRGKSMKELIVEAAERRLKDDKSCAVGHGLEAEQESKKAQDASIGVDAIDLQQGNETDKEEIPAKGIDTSRESAREQKVIDLTGDSDEEEVKDMGKNKEQSLIPKSAIKPSSSSTPSQSHLITQPNATSTIRNTSSSVSSQTSLHSPYPSSTSRSSHSASTSTAIPSPKSKNWTCETCTLINSATSSTCEACLTPRPISNDIIVGEGIKTDQGWYCGFCSYGPVDMERWSCEMCGQVRKWG